MADNNTDLPEGTDKVIAGASNTDTTGSGAVQDTTVIVDTSPDTAPDNLPAAGNATGPGDSGSLRDRFRSGTQQFTGQAGDKARGFVSQGLERSAEALGNVSRMIGDTATGLDERLGQDYGDYARRAAEAIESTANSLASKDPDELIDDTRNFVRKSPGVALAGAAVVGFLAARLFKSAFGSGTDDDGEGDGRGRREA